jgi:hypothetical protein
MNRNPSDNETCKSEKERLVFFQQTASGINTGVCVPSTRLFVSSSISRVQQSNKGLASREKPGSQPLNFQFKRIDGHGSVLDMRTGRNDRVRTSSTFLLTGAIIFMAI